MSGTRANTGSSRRKFFEAITIYGVVTFLFAILGALAGWMILGSAGMGAVFGVVIGYSGCVIGGYLLEDASRSAG